MPCVYILTNPAIPDLVKIGYTAGNAQDRAADISRGTGVPSAYEVKWFLETDSTESAFAVEQQVHSELSHHRHNRAREFFTCSIAVARDYIERVAYRLGAINNNLEVLSRLLQEEKDQKDYERREAAYRKILIEHFIIRGFKESEAISFANHPDNSYENAVTHRNSLCLNILERNNYDIQSSKNDSHWIGFVNDQNRLKKTKQEQALKELLAECEAAQQDIFNLDIDEAREHIAKNKEICSAVLTKNDFETQKSKNTVEWLSHISAGKKIYADYIEDLKKSYTSFASDFYKNKEYHSELFPTSLAGRVALKYKNQDIIGPYLTEPDFWRKVTSNPDLCYKVLKENNFDVIKAKKDSRWTDFLEIKRTITSIEKIKSDIEALKQSQFQVQKLIGITEENIKKKNKILFLSLIISIIVCFYGLNSDSGEITTISIIIFIGVVLYYLMFIDQKSIFLNNKNEIKEKSMALKILEGKLNIK